MMVRWKQGFAAWPVCNFQCDTCQRSSATGSTEQLEAANLHIRDICRKENAMIDFLTEMSCYQKSSS